MRKGPSSMRQESGTATQGRTAKILITNFHPGHGGGHLTYIRSIATSALADTYDIAIAAPATSAVIRMAKDRGLKYFETDFPGNIKEVHGVIRSINALSSILDRFPFEIIHTNGSRDHWIAVYWKLFCRKAPSLVRTRHASKKTRNDLIHRVVNNKITRANIFVSKGAKTLSELNGALKFDNSTVIPNGVDLDHFSPRPKDEELAREFSIAPDDFVFGSVAGLGPYKRVDSFLEAIAGLSFRKNIKIFVLGNEGHANKLTNLAIKLGLGNIFIYGGQQSDVRRFISLFDVGFIMSDAIENMSYASREMMAMGIPLISSNYSGLVENVDHGINGILVTPGNIEEIRSAIVKFADMDQNELKIFSVEARRKAERSFSLRTQLQLLEELYNNILVQRGIKGQCI